MNLAFWSYIILFCYEANNVAHRPTIANPIKLAKPRPSQAYMTQVKALKAEEAEGTYLA